jgi:hypothetical protein
MIDERSRNELDFLAKKVAGLEEQLRKVINNFATEEQLRKIFNNLDDKVAVLEGQSQGVIEELVKQDFRLRLVEKHTEPKTKEYKRVEPKDVMRAINKPGIGLKDPRRQKYYGEERKV